MNYEQLVKEHYPHAKLGGDMNYIDGSLYWWVEVDGDCIGTGDEMIDAWENAYNNIKKEKDGTHE